MKTFKSFFAALPLFALLLTGCVRTPPPPPEPDPNLVFTTVAIDAFSAINTPRNVVIRVAAWATLWDEHSANRYWAV